MKRRAFTLVEMMVVLAIIALLSALIFGAIGSLRDGNKRGSCQTNLNQIYAALRLYSQDNDGKYPYLKGANVDDSGSAPNDKAPATGRGLWSLYVYEQQFGCPASQPNCVRQGATDDAVTTGVPTRGLPLSPSDGNIPTSNDKRLPGVLASYLKSARAFHCPSDNYSHDHITYRLADGTTAETSVLSSQLEFQGADGRTHLNPFYLSYQVTDDYPGNVATYSTYRDSAATRQLRFFSTTGSSTIATPDHRSPDTTVITWCRFHRPLTSTGGTPSSVNHTNTYDIVLFLDGSVQSVPMQQGITSVNTNAGVCTSYHRVPLAIADSAPNPFTDSNSPDECQ